MMGYGSQLSDTRHTATHGQAATVASINRIRGKTHLAARPEDTFYRVRAKAATDPSATARILQCFARNGLIPHLFFAKLDGDGELSVEAWLRGKEFAPHILDRIVANIGAVVGVLSSELKCETQSPPEICRHK